MISQQLSAAKRDLVSTEQTLKAEKEKTSSLQEDIEALRRRVEELEKAPGGKGEPAH